jgi:DNA-directed RNA polymerase specialized sigma24 family protein
MRTDDIPMIAAKRYKRSCWWVDVEDLTQEAWTAVLRAKQTFDPAVGVPQDAYLWRAAVVHLKEYVWAQSAPVHAPTGKLRELTGVYGEPLSRTLPAVQERDEATLTSEISLTTLVRKEVRRTIMRQPRGEIAVDMLLEDYSLAEVCRRHNVGKGAVLSALRAARRALINNIALHRLWRKRCQ